jgi:NADPH:quinone reductase-like Zn-dependent oxidoreductase
VDYVYDNYGEEGTADLAMRTIRSGGVYILLPHSECFVTASQEPPCLAANPKPGVSQYNYSPETKYAAMGLDEMAGMFDAGQLAPRIDSVYTMDNIAAAFNRSSGNGAGGTSSHYGKIAVEM